MTRVQWLALGAAALLTSAASEAPPDQFDYRVAPEFSGGVLTAFDVELRAPGDASGSDILVLPDKDEASPSSAPAISHVEAEGGQVTDLGAGRLRISHPPDAPLHVRYRVVSGLPGDPERDTRAPVIRPDWFAVHGGTFFLMPQSRTGAPARVALEGFPAGWTTTASFAPTGPVSRLRYSLVIGGRNYRLARRSVGGFPITLAYPASFQPIADPLLDDAAKVLHEERAFWRAPGEPFFIGFVRLSDDGGWGGEGVTGGFKLFLGDKMPKDAWLYLLGHENLHTWISRRIGGFPKTDEDLEAWLNEGFTEALTARILLSSGLWSIDHYMADQNAALVRYGTSPVKTEPNSRILADRNRDFFVNKLPYDRGRLLALLWDAKTRRHTGGRIGLDDVLRAQVQEAARHPGGPSADQLFPRVVQTVAGLDLRDDIARHVDRGAAIELPSDTFGDCARVVDVTQPVFDRGFDFEATVRAHGHVVGIEPGGPADRAGLKDGDRIHYDEIPTRDSRVVLTYKVVEPSGSVRTVRYKPEGASLVTFQQIELTAKAKQHPQACAAEIARP